jgi:cyanophycinase
MHRTTSTAPLPSATPSCSTSDSSIGFRKRRWPNSKYQEAINSRFGTVARILFMEAVTACGAFTASADDANPLNLPLPVANGKVGSVMLHGGGSYIDEIGKFIELAGGRQAKIVLIPSGTYEQKDYGSKEEFVAHLESRYGWWLGLTKQGRIADFNFLYTDNQADADNAKFLANLREATGVWIPAAYQDKLALRFSHRFSKHSDNSVSLFQRLLRDVVARGGVVGGFGGGMAALPEVMIMDKIPAGEHDVPEAAIYPGLGLFNGAIVDQNFDAFGGRLERFTGLLKNTAELNEVITWPAAARNMIGLAVERNTAIIIQGNTIQLIGKRHAHVFLKRNGDRTISWEVLSPENPRIQLVAFSAQSPAAAPIVNPWARIDTTRKNPFGMPEPRNGAKPGTVVLHGGGPNRDLMAVYPSLAGAARPRLVHCPAASTSYQPQDGGSNKSVLPGILRDCREWIELREQGILASIDFLTTATRADADNEEFVLPLTKANAVWFSGGDQSELARLFVNSETPTRFQQDVIAVVARGGVVGGTSAGTAVMAKVMTVPGRESGEKPADPQISCGLGVLKNVILEQHYKGDGRGGRLERFTSLLLAKNLETNQKLRKLLEADGTKFDDMIGLAIEERTALLLQENRLRVFGKGHAHVFLKSADQRTIIWHELEPSDSAFVFFGPNGPILELDDWRVR